MAGRHILYFTGDEQQVYRRAGRTLELEATFPGNEEGLAGFRAFARRRRGALFAVLADLAGEDFHEEQIPYLRGADRGAVIQRRLAQRYRDTRLAAALSLGQARTPERRNERLLLASFTNTGQMTPWLDALEESDARLAGVYSVPLLAPALAAALGMSRGRCLVVTPHRAGLRQCFVEEGRLRFARLEPTAAMAPPALAVFVRSETLRLAQYLAALRALPRDGAPVRVIVVAPHGETAVFEETLASDALQFATIDVHEAARRVGLRRIPQGAAAESLYLYLTAKNPPREQFATRDDRRRFLVWQVQRGIVAAGATALVACALYAGLTWFDAQATREATQMQAQLAREAARQYARITASFPVTQTSTENMRVTVVEFQRLAQRSASPEGAWLAISQILDRFPQFEVDRILWTAGSQAESLKPSAASIAVQLEISGRVSATQRDDYRGITARVQSFAAEFENAGYRLVRTQLPFDVTPQGVLTGDIGAANDTGQAPRFTIVLTRRLP